MLVSAGIIAQYVLAAQLGCDEMLIELCGLKVTLVGRQRVSKARHCIAGSRAQLA